MILNLKEEVPDGNARKRKLLEEYKFGAMKKVKLILFLMLFVILSFSTFG